MIVVVAVLHLFVINTNSVLLNVFVLHSDELRAHLKSAPKPTPTVEAESSSSSSSSSSSDSDDSGL